MRFGIVGIVGCGVLAATACAGAARPVRVSLTGPFARASALTVTAPGGSRAVEAEGRRVLAEAGAGARWSVSRGTGAERGLRLTLTHNGKEQRFEARSLRIEARAGGALRVAAGAVERVYPEIIEIHPSASGWTVINETPRELYLQGVVSAEVGARWHPEALKALAVAARSYTERNRGRHGSLFDLCDGTHCHCYAGTGKVGESIREAVAATAGIVALHEGRPIDAVYSADCGGRTQTVQDAWGSKREIGYLRSVVDAPEGGGPDYCSINPKHSWSLTVAAAQLERALNAGTETRVGTLRRVEVVGTNESGRPAAVEVLGGAGPVPAELDRPACELAEEEGTAARRAPVQEAASALVIRRLTLEQFRRMLEAAAGSRTRAGSMLGLLPRPDGGLVVEGKGTGHGVGLCQYGAQGMAARYGKSWEEILHHYYTGISLGPAP